MGIEQSAALEIEVPPAAADQEPILSNLLELYSHDFSEFADLDLQSDGRFHYPWLSHYWQEEGRYPFLVRVGGQLAGFVLVSRGSRISADPMVWDMAEFFIVRKYRRRGIGLNVARQIWARFPGQWEVRALVQNAPAVRFWAAATLGLAANRAEVLSEEASGKRWEVFSLRSAPQPA